VTTWIILRAAGIGSYIALWLAVDWGLIATTSLVTKRVSKPTSTLFHGVVASAGLALLVIHLAGLLVDKFMPFGLLDLVIPMRATYRTLAVSFGVLAMYAMVLILVTSWIRKRLSTKLWRAIHLLAIPTFTLALAHGVFAGTDSSRPWMFAIYVVTGLLTLFLVIVRGLTYGYRPPRAERPATRAAVVTPEGPSASDAGGTGPASVASPVVRSSA
jgi:methionine sulfoxide reductase heme-binding subunit